MSELEELERGEGGGLGVVFIEVKKGDRICECDFKPWMGEVLTRQSDIAIPVFVRDAREK